jgi:ClpP class serine protease
MSNHATRALLGEYWAIEPSWLPVISTIAQRDTSSPTLEAAREWTKRDYLAMAGPGARPLPGASRAYVVDGVAVLPITGPIFPRANLLTEMSGATSVAVLRADHTVALASHAVAAIMLLIDSPGGAVSGIADFAARIASGANRKPTRAFVMGSAASAAYWIGSQASMISADRTAVVGSIGVVAAVPKQMQPDRDGYIDIEVVSSNAPNKRPDPTSEGGVAVIREQLNALEDIFIGDVARGRKTTPAAVKNGYGQGGVIIGSAAVKAGMVDKIESQASAMNALVQMGKLKGRPTGAAAISAPPTSQREANLARLARLRH